MKCKRCGRWLKNPRSVVNEMGPVCFKKWKRERDRQEEEAGRAPQQVFPEMRNLRMKEKLAAGQAIDVSSYPVNSDGDYVLKGFTEDVDYCDAKAEEWIWSIGRMEDGQILASTTNKFYQAPGVECLFLR